MAKIRCFLCGQKLLVRTDKNGRPYAVCDVCQAQYFMRGRQAIKNLERLIKVLREHEFIFREHDEVLQKVHAIVAEIGGLHREIEELDSQFNLFESKGKNQDRERVRKALNARVENLISMLNRIAHSAQSA